MSKLETLTDAEIERFWSWVDRTGPDDCWKWGGATDKNGYGCFAPHMGRWFRAHRVACYLEHGDAGKMTCHTCDNPGCCNPAHLYPGDAKTNGVDRDRNGCPWRGSKQHLAKLTEEQVITIMQLHAKGLTNRQIADCIGCTCRLVNRVRTGECWNWMTKLPKRYAK